jgi:integral membrane protein
MRYRAMAYLVGTLLIVLVVIGIPLRYGAGHPVVATVVGPIHGFCYIAYLVVGYDLARRARLTLWQMIAMAAAGLVPFLTFFIERRVSHLVEGQLDRAAVADSVPS